MKNLSTYIVEASKADDLWEQLMEFFNIDEYEGKNKNKLEKLIDDFIDGAHNLTFESSTVDYWEDCGIDVKITNNENLWKELESILPRKADWVGMDFFSVKVDGNVLMMSSQTGAYANGDYFDLKVTKS